MGVAAKTNRHTVAEYLSREEKSLDRHEYRDGEIVLMAGNSAEHSLIVANLIRAIGNRTGNGPCRVYDSNLRIGIARSRSYVYPDVTVICGQREADPNDPRGQTFTNPRLVIEVTSPSTEIDDRGRKFRDYLLLDSLQEYVIVSQQQPRVETYFRQDDGTWLFRNVSELDGVIRLRSVEIEVALAEIYAGVEFASE
ncbi:MAG TPA: Uma2 family endonuclease [Tepidisphaeraceae bacterium]|nr:Uma2 family endonuclease [Tepidisphaeraceae bacterium]